MQWMKKLWGTAYLRLPMNSQFSNPHHKHTGQARPVAHAPPFVIGFHGNVLVWHSVVHHDFNRPSVLRVSVCLSQTLSHIYPRRWVASAMLDGWRVDADEVVMDDAWLRAQWLAHVVWLVNYGNQYTALTRLWISDIILISVQNYDAGAISCQSLLENLPVFKWEWASVAMTPSR